MIFINQELESRYLPKLKTRDKTVSKTISLIGFSGGGVTGMVDVKDGRIVRVRPFN